LLIQPGDALGYRPEIEAQIVSSDTDSTLPVPQAGS
jgi:hypothetical protein